MLGLLAVYFTYLFACYVETLTPQTEARHQAERVRDNLSACIAMGECNPKAAEILLPNVLTAAHEYLAAIGKN